MIITRAIIFFCRPPNVKPNIFFNPIPSVRNCLSFLFIFPIYIILFILVLFYLYLI